MHTHISIDSMAWRPGHDNSHGRNITLWACDHTNGDTQCQGFHFAPAVGAAGYASVEWDTGVAMLRLELLGG